MSPLIVVLAYKQTWGHELSKRSSSSTVAEDPGVRLRSFLRRVQNSNAAPAEASSENRCHKLDLFGETHYETLENHRTQPIELRRFTPASKGRAWTGHGQSG